MAVGAAVALHADAADVGEQHDGALPDLVVEAGGGELLAGDGVGGAQRLEPVVGDLADDPDAEAGPGERLAADDRRGQPELGADLAHLVLEQRPQRLDQRELDVVGQAADVVVALDRGGAGAAAGLDDVGVERALHEEADPSLAAAAATSAVAASNTRMNSRPMILRLVSGSVTPASASRNRSAASTVCRRAPVAATKSRSTCSRSPARSSPWSTNTQVSRSPMARWTRAAATAESTPPDSPQIARPSPTWARTASTVSSMIDAVVQSAGDARDLVQEALEHLLAVRRVADLGVVLHAREPPVGVLERRDGRALRRRGDGEPVRRARRPSRRGSSRPGAARGGRRAARRRRHRSSVRPYSRVPSCATSPPSASAMAWKP